MSLGGGKDWLSFPARHENSILIPVQQTPCSPEPGLPVPATVALVSAGRFSPRFGLDFGQENDMFQGTDRAGDQLLFTNEGSHR
jgi:hypothetical protein